MYKYIILLGASILLFVLGYNFVFNTAKMIRKYLLLSNYKEGTYLHRVLSGQGNILWVKVAGILVIIFALILLCSLMILLMQAIS